MLQKAADLSPEVYTEELISQGFNPYKFKIKTPEVVAEHLKIKDLGVRLMLQNILNKKLTLILVD